MSFVAGCTEQVRLGSGICLLPQRNPVYTGKEVATADWLSNGRVDLGIGVGWLREEFDALGVPFERRGRRADDYIRVLKTLWTNDLVDYDSEFVSLRGVRQDPKPVQDPHPPIVVGGESDAALRRVVRLGDGWFGFGHTVETAADRIAKLRELLAEADRPLDQVQIKVCPYFNPVDEAMLEGLAELGVGEVVAFFFAGSAEEVPGALDALQPLADRAHALEDAP
jgi:probable F420-dependent oxidoreductase